MELVLEGRYRNVLEFDPQYPRISILPAGPARVEISIRPGSDFPYTLEEVVPEDPRLAVRQVEAVDAAGHHRIVLEWAGSGSPPETAVCSRLEARLRLADGSSRAESIPVSARYEPVFSPSPTAIFFRRSQTAALAGANPAPVVREIVLERNHPGIPFALHDVRLAGKAEGIFALEWETLEPGERARIRVRVRERPPSPGRITDSLLIHTGDPRRPVHTVAVHAYFD